MKELAPTHKETAASLQHAVHKAALHLRGKGTEHTERSIGERREERKEKERKKGRGEEGRVEGGREGGGERD